MADYIKRDSLLALSRDYTRHDGKSEEAVPVRAIKNIPSADVTPVVHGKWVEQEDGFGDTYYDCSCCGESFCLIEGTPTDNMYNFCPNCGARMDYATGNFTPTRKITNADIIRQMSDEELANFIEIMKFSVSEAVARICGITGLNKHWDKEGIVEEELKWLKQEEE